MLIRLDNIHKSYGAATVLCGVSFQLGRGDRVGLVGRNGAGKTTILRLIKHEEEADEGKISIARGVKLGFLDQRPAFDGPASVRDEAISVFDGLKRMESEMSRLEHEMASGEAGEIDGLMHEYSDLRHAFELAGGFTYPSTTEAVLFGLGFNRADLDSPSSILSGGQKARLALAKLLLCEPDLLLLDEPTNHLDVGAVEWLEDFLKEYRKAFLIISHDRFLLDRVATRIIEVDNRMATSYNGNYSAYVRQRDEKRLTMARLYDRQREMISRTEEFIRRNLAGQKTKQAKSRRNMLERLDRVESVQDAAAADFSFQDEGASKRKRGSNDRAVHGHTALSSNGLSIGYGPVNLASRISFTIQTGDHLAIVGPNGCGKTTLLKTLAEAIPARGGEFWWAANTRIGLYDQELTSLNDEATVFAELQAAVGRRAASESEVRNFLAGFLFTGDTVFKPVGTLSGGERSRLALAKLIYSQPNVLLLDEPTNHLDIPSREALEAALLTYAGTIVTVSHDRYFLGKVASCVLSFEAGSETATAAFHDRTFADFYESERQPQSAARKKAKGLPPRPAQSVRKRTPSDSRPAGEIEAEIARVESDLGGLTDQLSGTLSGRGAAEIAELGIRHQEVSNRLEALYKEWEVAHEAEADS